MQMTLRVARRLISHIQAQTSYTVEPLGVSINPYDPRPAREIVEEASTDLMVNVTKRQKLLAALFTLRRAVQEANEEVGINNLLAQKEHMQQELSMWRSITAHKTLTDNDIAALDREKAAKAANDNTTSSLSNSRILVTSVVAPTLMEAATTAERHLLQKLLELEDEILALNATTKITIDDETEHTLRQSNLI